MTEESSTVRLVNFPHAAKAIAEIVRLAKRSYPGLKAYTALKACPNAKRAVIDYYKRPEEERELITEWIQTSALLRELILQGEIQAHLDNIAREITNGQTRILTHVGSFSHDRRSDEADYSRESSVLPGFLAYKRFK
jgi:hypothetical protein